MSETTLPKPLSAYVGLLLASLEDARGSGGSPVAQAARLPRAAASQLRNARRRYDELAAQGDEVIDIVVGMVRQRFGASTEEASEWIGDEFATARGRAAAAVGVTGAVAEQVTEKLTGAIPGKVTGVAGRVASTVTSFTGARTKEFGGQNGQSAAPERAPAESPATSEPTALEQVEQYEAPAELREAAGGVVSHDELPLPDFDHMTMASLRGRLRRLDRVSLVQLLDYERAHANRLPIVLLLENRLDKMLATGDDGGAPETA